MVDCYWSRDKNDGGIPGQRDPKLPGLGRGRRPPCPAWPRSPGRGPPRSSHHRSRALRSGQHCSFAVLHLPHLPEFRHQRRPGRGSPASSERAPATCKGRLRGAELYQQQRRAELAPARATSADPRAGARPPPRSRPLPAAQARTDEDAAPGSLLPAGGRREGGRGSWFRTPLRPLVDTN